MTDCIVQDSPFNMKTKRFICNTLIECMGTVAVQSIGSPAKMVIQVLPPKCTSYHLDSIMQHDNELVFQIKHVRAHISGQMVKCNAINSFIN